MVSGSMGAFRIHRRIHPSWRGTQERKSMSGGISSCCASLPPLEIGGTKVSVAEGTGAIRAYEAMVYGVERNELATREKLLPETMIAEAQKELFEIREGILRLMDELRGRA